jgi:tryptophanase
MCIDGSRGNDVLGDQHCPREFADVHAVDALTIKLIEEGGVRAIELGHAISAVETSTRMFLFCSIRAIVVKPLVDGSRLIVTPPPSQS